jgi:hypothetical protein
VARGAVLAGLVAFLLLAGAQTFDQPRPRGAEIAREQAPLPRGAEIAREQAPLPRGPTPPFARADEPRPRGCPRETLVRFSLLEAWIRELPLGGILAGVAARRLVGSCSAGA